MGHLVEDIQEIPGKGILITTSNALFNKLTERELKRLKGRIIQFFSNGHIYYEAEILDVHVNTSLSELQSLEFLIPTFSKDKIILGSEMKFFDIKY